MNLRWKLASTLGVAAVVAVEDNLVEKGVPVEGAHVVRDFPVLGAPVAGFDQGNFVAGRVVAVAVELQGNPG